MIYWFFLGFTLILNGKTYINAQGAQYECGEHGRFEYCIDGIPGCVIGCYCHPGYYFDTETKICEHNSKLTQSYRRQFLPDATTLSEQTIAPITELPPTTEAVMSESKVGNGAPRDNDDLSDWLYNQFFKTVENQVINQTDNDAIQTRRSGTGGPVARKVKKRKTSKRKRSSKRKRYKKDDLRRKLLRISEDDSLFDDSTSSDDYDDESSSSGSSAESESCDESQDDNNRGSRHKSHKKMILIQKKAKPPLPSFIFLPNADTPFYPPIGLPPPPVVPMYPMIPVPPMFISQDNNKSNTTDSTPSVTTSSATHKTSGTTNKTPSTATQTETTDRSTANPENMERMKNYNNKKRKASKYMQYLREQKKKGLSVNSLVDPLIKYRKPLPVPSRDPDAYDDNMYDETFTYNDPQPQRKDIIMPQVNDVDFKYLSQLIHKIDPTGMNELPALHFSPNDTIGMQEIRKTQTKKPNITSQSKPSRRMYTGQSQQVRPYGDDSYYTNLGRQIASLIRRANSEDGGQVNVELEQINRRNSNQPDFYDNRYAPPSYWERSVRSPYSRVEKFDYIKNSNENLYDLENKVAIAATTPPTFNLQQLENIINTIQKAQQGMDRTISLKRNSKNNPRYSTSSNSNLNINLLKTEKPKQMPLQRENNTRKMTMHWDSRTNRNMNPKSPRVNLFNTFAPRFQKGTKAPDGLQININKTYVPTVQRQPSNIKYSQPFDNEMFVQDKVFKVPQVRVYQAGGSKQGYKSLVRFTTMPPTSRYGKIFKPALLNYKVEKLSPVNNQYVMFDEFQIPFEKPGSSPYFHRNIEFNYFDI